MSFVKSTSSTKQRILPVKATTNISSNLSVSGTKPLNQFFGRNATFKEQISDLQKRTISGKCEVHGPDAREHQNCPNCGYTCIECLRIAAKAFEGYSNNNERLRIPICTCDIEPVMVRTMGGVERTTYNNESLVIYKLSKKIYDRKIDEYARSISSGNKKMK